MTKDITKKKVPLENYILEKLNGMESRLMNKIEDTSVNFKEYVDSRISPVQHQVSSLQKQMSVMQKDFSVMQKDITLMQQNINSMNTSINKLDKKLDVRTDGLVKLIETRVGEIIDLDKRVTILELR